MIDRDPKVLTMLAGADAQLLFYQMQPAFLADARFSVASIATSWTDCEKNLIQLKPHLLVVQADIAPSPEALLSALARMQVWNGLALVLLQSAHQDLRGVYERAGVCRGIFILPLNWGEVVQAGYAAVATERARSSAQAPLQNAVGLRSTTAITGTRVVAFLSGSGGTGRSTVAESVAYELAVRMNVRTLLASFDLPPAAVMHFNLHYSPHAGEYFARPGEGFSASIQSRETLDVLVAPENSLEYARAGESSTSAAEKSPIHSLVMASWTRNYAAVLLDLPAGEGSWTLQPLVAANTALIVTRTTLADLAATRHLLVLLLERMRGEHRIPQESIFMVLNHVSEHSSITPRGFYEELTASYGWAPPVLAVLPYDPGIPRAQDAQKSPILTVDSLASGTRSILQGLFPGLESLSSSRSKGKSTGLLRGLMGRPG